MTLFLSHSSIDKPFVTRLAFDLTERNFPVWFDMWQLEVGDDMRERIYADLRKMGSFIVVISEHSVKSDWVKDELGRWLQFEDESGCVPNPSRRPLLLPIRVDHCKPQQEIADRMYLDF